MDTTSQMPMPSVIRQPLDPTLSIPAPQPGQGLGAQPPTRQPLQDPTPNAYTQTQTNSPVDLPPTAQAATPGASAAPTVPWEVKAQEDGSSVYQVPNPSGGDPIVIGVNPAPKLPRALQPAQPTKTA